MQLKSCPFCGSLNVRVVLYNKPCVVCFNCSAGGPSAEVLTFKPNNKYKCNIQAIKLWNKRNKNYK